MTVSIYGGDPAYTDYPRVETVETPAAVSVVTVPRDVGPRVGFRHPVAHVNRVTAALAGPLGPRVLVHPGGTPITVEAVGDA